MADACASIRAILIGSLPTTLTRRRWHGAGRTQGQAGYMWLIWMGRSMAIRPILKLSGAYALLYRCILNAAAVCVPWMVYSVCLIWALIALFSALSRLLILIYCRQCCSVGLNASSLDWMRVMGVLLSRGGAKPHR